MNLFSKYSFLAIFVSAVVFSATPSEAITVYGLHTGSCSRSLGAILHVEPLTVQFLTLAGEVVEIPRYEIIYLSYYNLTALPLSKKVSVPEGKTFSLKTKVHNEIVPLLTGWPVDFTQDRVAFLSPEGSEILIDRSHIWGIQYAERQTEITPMPSPIGYQFVEPYSFKDCKDDSVYPNKSFKKVVQVYPVQGMSEPISIKRELDRLQAGYDGLHRYVREQRFYGVPQTHQNAASLGIWYSVGNRYGSSSTRTSNLLPVLVSEKSAGPYDYQHIIVTGVGPNEKLTHEEPQSQAYYEFKASYFHLYTMLDPNILLVGGTYKWQANDLVNPDARMNDTFLLSLGFDYSGFSIGFGSASQSYGLYDGHTFMNGTLGLGETHLQYQNHLFKAEALFGSGQISDQVDAKTTGSASLSRFSVTSSLYEDVPITYSFISKSISANSLLASGENVSMSSNTHSLRAQFRYRKQYLLGAYGAIESDTIKANPVGFTSSDNSQNNLKFGVSVSLQF